MLTRVDFYIFYARTISETVLKHFGMFLNDRFVPLIILATRSQANTLRYFGVGQTVPFPFPNPFPSPFSPTVFGSEFQTAGAEHRYGRTKELQTQWSVVYIIILRSWVLLLVLYWLHFNFLLLYHIRDEMKLCAIRYRVESSSRITNLALSYGTALTDSAIVALTCEPCRPW